MWTEHIVDFFVKNPSMAIFLVLAVGYFIGRFKYKMLSLGTVTSVLLVGILFGILVPDVKIGAPLKDFFFLLFLFAIGYSVGPQFFRGFRKTGLPQVIFAVMMCAICLIVTWICAKIAGYNAGEAVGLFSGAQTISAVIGVGQQTIQGLNESTAMKESMSNVIPVIYAVTYVFGTAGSAWIIAFLCPQLLGGMKKCRDDCKAQEAEMGDSLIDQPGYSDSRREVAFRCYKVENEWFNGGKKISEIHDYVSRQGRRVFIDRVRHNGTVVDTPDASLVIVPGDEIVLSGRREYIIGEENWIGHEITDPELLSFAIKTASVLLHNKKYEGKTVRELLSTPFMEGVSIKNIKRGELNVPVRANVTLERGDMITVVGMPYDVDTASKQIGLVKSLSTSTDIIYLSLGILIGGIIGVLSFTLGDVPVSLTTSGGALVMGLVFGWWHSRRPNYGQIPAAAEFVFRDLGLNVFIAIVGLSCGPDFLHAFKSVGFMIFVWGALATTIPLLLGILAARYIFRMRPGTALGCVAGARTTTAALGAVEESMHSSVPAMGYAVTYAVGNTLLILSGVIMVILCA